MTIACSMDCGEAEWYYTNIHSLITLHTKRAKRCTSCKQKLHDGDTVLPFDRWRDPKNYIESKIYSEEVPLATWYMCKHCAPIYSTLESFDIAIDIGTDNMVKLLQEFEAQYSPISEFQLKLIKIPFKEDSNYDAT